MGMLQTGGPRQSFLSLLEENSLSPFKGKERKRERNKAKPKKTKWCEIKLVMTSENVDFPVENPES